MTELATASSTRTVERALALLAEVCDHERVTLAQCARSTQLPASTALRLLRTLEARSFVRRDEDGAFAAGPRMIQLGAMSFGGQALATLAEPALRRIVAECGETSYLLIAGPSGSALTIAMVEGTYSVRHASWVGHRITVGDGAVGQTLDGLVRTGEYVACASESEPDVTVVAAPVPRPLFGASVRAAHHQLEPTRSVVAAISVVGPTYRLDRERVQAIGALVGRESQVLARAYAAAASPLGGPPGALAGSVTTRPIQSANPSDHDNSADPTDPAHPAALSESEVHAG